MNQKTSSFLTLILFIVCLSTSGQTSIWLGTRQLIKLKNDYQLRFWQEQRYFSIIKNYDRTFGEVSLKKSFKNNWAIDVPLRYSTLNPRERRTNEFRMGIQGSKTLKINAKQGLGFRTFYQIDRRWGEQNALLLNWRNKVDFIQNWFPNWQSKLENEFWYRTQSPYQFERYRLTLSNSIKLNDKNALSLAYFVQHTIPYDASPWERVLFVRYEVGL